MPTGKLTQITRKTVKVPTKRGTKLKVIKDKTVTKATNQSKGSGVQTVFKTEKGKLAAKEIQAKENIARAKVIGRNTDVATITSGLAGTISSGIGRIQPGSSEQRDVNRVGKVETSSAIDQAVNGGITQSAPSRDEDDEDEESAFID